jgi:hypothetical protein
MRQIKKPKIKLNWSSRAVTKLQFMEKLSHSSDLFLISRWLHFSNNEPENTLSLLNTFSENKCPQHLFIDFLYLPFGSCSPLHPLL